MYHKYKCRHCGKVEYYSERGARNLNNFKYGRACCQNGAHAGERQHEEKSDAQSNAQAPRNRFLPSARESQIDRQYGTDAGSGDVGKARDQEQRKKR